MSGLKGFVCAGCNREVERQVRGGAKDAGRYCTRGCAFRHKGMIAAERSALRRIAANERRDARSRRSFEIRQRRQDEMQALLARVCCDCKSEFQQRTHEGRPEKRCGPCSVVAKASADAKSRRTAKARRRAIERGSAAQHIDPVRVFERDKWRCHLCGCRTPARLRGTWESTAPELDHVVTLADGGQHTWGNVACACRACNQAKGAYSKGQLGLGIAA